MWKMTLSKLYLQPRLRNDLQRRWLEHELLGLMKPLELGFPIPVWMLTLGELLHSRSPVLVAFCPLWDLRIPYLSGERDTFCSLSVLLSMFTGGRSSSASLSSALGTLALHVPGCWSAFKKAHASFPSICCKHWVTVAKLLRCGCCQVIS